MPARTLTISSGIDLYKASKTVGISHLGLLRFLELFVIDSYGL
jgi:hypothetical protein